MIAAGTPWARQMARAAAALEPVRTELSMAHGSSVIVS
jgi:hypothetical protein